MANLGNLAESGVIALAVSEAAGAVVEPALEPARQEAEKATKARIHDLDQLAQSVAQALLALDDVTDHAARNGYDQDELALSVQLALRAPGVSEALGLYRRRALDNIDDATALARLHHAFAKAQVEYQYWPQLVKTADLPLDPAVIANAIVRGVIKAPFPLPYTPPTGTGKIAAFPQSDLDATQEAEASGTNVDRLFVETAIAGRPMAPEEAATATFRGILDPDDYLRAILEGDIRGEWANAIFERARQILTAHDWVELHLRGYIKAPEMYAGTALHGMSTADTDRLFQVLGRPLTVHQITTGLARGGTFNPIHGELTDPYEASVHESNIKPSYYDLAIANRYQYPSLFQLNSLVKANAITADEAADWANKDGYAPEVVTVLHSFWTGEQASATTTSGVRTKTFTYSQIHQAWRNSVFGTGPTNDQIALSELEDIGYPPAKAQILLDTWKSTPPPSSATA